MPRDDFVCAADINKFLGIGFHHPDNFLNIAGHQLKAFLALPEGSLGDYALRDVAENDDMLAGGIRRCRGVVYEKLRTVTTEEFDIPALILLLHESGPGLIELLGCWVKGGNGMPYQSFWLRAKDREGCRVGFDADTLIVENQNSVQSIL